MLFVRQLLRDARPSFSLFLAGIACLGGCSNQDTVAEPLTLGWGTAHLQGAPADDSCRLGDERSCFEKIEQASGVVSCRAGVQSCGDEGWGDCLEGDTFQMPVNEASESGPHILALSGAPTSCNNVCDPGCHHWLETTSLLGVPATPPPPPAPTCAHSPCETGAALDASCEACVSTVCADSPECCDPIGGAWTSSCIARSYQLCLNEARPLSLCDYGLFSDSTDNVTITSLAQQSDITIGGRGNFTISGGLSVEEIVTAGLVYLSSATFPPGGVTALGRITLNSSSSNTPIGPLESADRIDMYTTPIVHGDVRAQQDVVWETNVYGNVLAGGTVNLQGGCAASVFGGTCTSHSTHLPPQLNLPSLPAQTFTCGGMDLYMGGADHTLVPGNYGDVYVGGTLTLDGSGTYNFDRLYVGGLKVLHGGSLVTIESCNEVNLLTNAQVVDASDLLLDDPTRLLINVKGNLHFDSNVDWVGLILAGSSGTKTGGSIHGTIWASPVNDINNQDFIRGIERDTCLDLNIPGTVPAACPFVTPVGPPGPDPACAPGDPCSGVVEHEEPYVATCADSATSPRWGLLTYNATIPGSSTIELWGRVGRGDTDAEAEADAATQTYTHLFTADHTQETCGLASGPSCPLDLTALLSLDGVQGHHIDLKVVLQADGANVPSLDDWGVTYSCVFDQ